LEQRVADDEVWQGNLKAIAEATTAAAKTASDSADAARATVEQL
jgi:hypothetical protein